MGGVLFAAVLQSGHVRPEFHFSRHIHRCTDVHRFDAFRRSRRSENPRRNVLLATVLVCVVTGVLSSLEVYAAQLVWGSKPFPAEQVESAFPLVAKQAGGFFLFQLLNFTILIANIGSGMGAQLAAARLLYGMGRNDALPKGFSARSKRSGRFRKQRDLDRHDCAGRFVFSLL